MKSCSTIYIVTAFFIIFSVLVSVAMSSRNIAADRSSHETRPRNAYDNDNDEEAVRVVAGSSLPDCSHACGSCWPCKLVMVSFVCASIAESETCPMAYKCMCGHKSFPVP